jgi:hypothetical protein
LNLIGIFILHMEGKLIYLIFPVLLAFCGEKTPSLEQCNWGFKNGLLEPADSLINNDTKYYCFEIHHDQVDDLTKLHLEIDINGTSVYSNKFKRQVIVPFNKKTTLNTFTVCLYDATTKTFYCWSNKEVYDFKERSVKCYEITLLSFKNMNNSDGIQMEVD